MNPIPRLLHRLLRLGLVLGLLLLPAEPALAQTNAPLIHITQVDTSKFPQVTVYVSAVDASGEPAPVDPNQIQIYENGQLMKPEAVSAAGQIGSLTTLLVIDTSGSMRYANKLAGAKAAAEAYVDQMRPGDQAGLLTFDTQVNYRQPITQDRSALKQAIDQLTTGGDTAMYDALLQAAQILQDISGRKAIILMTDGMDNRSKSNAEAVIAAIGASGLSISTIGLGLPDESGAISGVDEAALQSLANRAGGVYGYANGPQALVNLYEQYGRTLQSEYRITYLSSSALRDGFNRSLTVSLLSGASAQARYNPGGVLPEVAQGVSWPVFLLLLGGLLLLLVLPGLINRRPKPEAHSLPTRKEKTHIKLK
jgi:VWFA-related protein